MARDTRGEVTSAMPSPNPPTPTSAALTLGVVASSRKKHERRLPLHPRHLPLIEPELRRRIVLEEGYGHRFGFSNDELARLVGGIASREDVLAASDVVVLPKPLHADVA